MEKSLPHSACAGPEYSQGLPSDFGFLLESEPKVAKSVGTGRGQAKRCRRLGAVSVTQRCPAASCCKESSLQTPTSATSASSNSSCGEINLFPSHLSQHSARFLQTDWKMGDVTCINWPRCLQNMLTLQPGETTLIIPSKVIFWGFTHWNEASYLMQCTELNFMQGLPGPPPRRPPGPPKPPGPPPQPSGPIPQSHPEASFISSSTQAGSTDQRREWSEAHPPLPDAGVTILQTFQRLRVPGQELNLDDLSWVQSFQSGICRLGNTMSHQEWDGSLSHIPTKYSIRILHQGKPFWFIGKQWRWLNLYRPLWILAKVVSIESYNPTGTFYVGTSLVEQQGSPVPPLPAKPVSVSEEPKSEIEAEIQPTSSEPTNHPRQPPQSTKSTIRAAPIMVGLRLQTCSARPYLCSHAI